MLRILEPIDKKHPVLFRLAKLAVRLAVVCAVVGFAYTVYMVSQPQEVLPEAQHESGRSLSHEEEMVQLKGRLAVALERIDQLEAELAEAKAKLPGSK